MRLWQELRFIVRRFINRRRAERELDEEIRAQLGTETERNIADGMSPEKVQQAARRSFGSVALSKEDSRSMWGFRSLEVFWQDLRYGLRMLFKNPGFTTIAVLTLSLGIGANTAIFTLLDKVLIRPLPVERPHQLVTFVEDAGGAPAIFSYPLYAELRDRNDVLSGVVAYEQRPFSISDGSQTERVIGQIVSGNYFSVLGVRPALGRFFLPEEDRTPNTHPVIVISHGLWRRRFGADPAVIGKTLSLNAYRYTVVGVAPSEFTGTTRGTVNDVYAPIMMQARVGARRDGMLDNPNAGWLTLLGRLKPNVSRQQAQSALATPVDDAAKTFPGKNDDNLGNPNKVFLMDGSRGHTDRVKDLSTPLKLLMGVVGFVLAVACANIANLLLARASARRKEVAVRLALGAGRWRIVRQLLTESAILATLGGGAGLLVAYWFTGLLLRFQQQTNYVPRALDGSLDERTLGFTLGLSLVTGIVFGLAPALVASKPDFVAALKEETPGLGRMGRRLSLRNMLVVTQVALSLVVLIGAALCVKSLRALQAIDPGFEPAKVVTASFDLGQNGYNEARGRQFIGRLTERAAALPGVEAVSFAYIVAFSDTPWIGPLIIEGSRPQPVNINAISPDYFQTLGASLAQGREFTAQDTVEAPLVAIVNEAAARRYWPGQDVIGKRIVRNKQIDRPTRYAEVVGVVRDSKEKSLTADPRPALYLPLLQNFLPELTLHVRTATPSQSLLAAVRREAQLLDPTLPIYNLQTLAQQKDGTLYTERLAAALLTLFGLLALSLAAVGIYGVLSYAVNERTREMGVRLALGARPRDLLKLIVGQGLILTFIGLAIGVGASFALTRLIAKLLFGVSATDPLTFGVIPLLLIVVALLACWIPARRATRVDPLAALRYQ
jgi:predicted permease